MNLKKTWFFMSAKPKESTEQCQSYGMISLIVITRPSVKVTDFMKSTLLCPSGKKAETQHNNQCGLGQLNSPRKIKQLFLLIIISLFFTILSAGAQAAVPETLDFRNPTITNGGTNLAVGTQYRFQNVGIDTNGFAVDALVTIASKSANSTLIQFDDNTEPFTAGVSDFRPVVQNSLTTPIGDTDGDFVEFFFEFVLNSDNTQAVTVETNAYSLDIDGSNSNLREYVIITSFGAYVLENPSELNFIAPSRFESSTDLVNPGINANSEFMARTDYAAISTFTYRAGVLRDAGTSVLNRLFALAFEPLVFNNPVTVVTVPVTLSGFQALPGDTLGAVNFYWTTATEVGNVAFNLYQQIDGEWELINDQPIPSHVIDSIQTQQYSYQAYGLDSQTFGIEDIDLYGAAVMHGPFPLNRAVGISQQPVQQRSPIKQKTPERIDWKAIGQEHRRNKAERKTHQQEQMQEKMNELDNQVVEDLSAWSGGTTVHERRYSNNAVPQRPSWTHKLIGGLVALLISPAHATPEQTPGLGAPQSLPVLTQTDPAAIVAKRRFSGRSTELMNLSVQATGIYRVTYEQLLAEGLDLHRIRPQWISLRNRGQDVPMTVYLNEPEREASQNQRHRRLDRKKQNKKYSKLHKKLRGKKRRQGFGPGSYIEFYGEAINSLYTDRNIYTLNLNKSGGLRSDVDNSAIPGTAALSYFMDTEIVEPKVEYSFANPGDDPWFSEKIIAFNSKTVDLPITLDGYVANPDPQSDEDAIHYSVALWGGNDFPGNSETEPDHHVIIGVNDQQQADETFDGIVNREITGILPSVEAGLNIISVTVPADTPYFVDVVNIEQWQITYPRGFQSDGSGLAFNATGIKYEVTGLNSDDIVVYRRVENGALTQINGLDIDCISADDCSVSFAGNGQAADYFVKTTAGLLTPSAFEPVPEFVKIKKGKAELLVISNPDFIDGLRDSGAILNPNNSYASVKIVDVETIYAQFGDHLVDANAIDDYIQYAYEKLGTRHVLIVGGDSYDPNGYLGLGAISFVPTLYTATDNLIKWAPVDALYGDTDGDNIPDLVVGRMPVRTQTELQTILAKTEAYGDRNYDKTAVFASDAFDVNQNYDFKADAEALITDHFGDWQVTRAYIDDLGSSAAHDQLISSINAGVALTGFIGHSAPSQWTFNTPPLLKAADLSALTNIGKPTVVAQLGCWNTYYVSPHENTMGHQFMLNGDRGAVAVIGASTLTGAVSEHLLAQEIFAHLQSGVLLGDAILEGKRAYAQIYPNQKDVILGWTLLGHPGLIM